MRIVRLLAALVLLAAPACAADSVVWTFDRLANIGDAPTHVEGAPKLIDTGAGQAILFDGEHDALFVDKHPLAGYATFTAEAVFRPDGGAFEQRWMHLAETDPATGVDTGTRFLFEIRVVGDRWCLDVFTTGPGYNKPMMVTEKTFPIGRWYRVAMSYDGKMFRSYVDGVLQMEAPIVYKPQGPGHSSIGTRINRVNYFKGAVFEARFTPRALAPDEFMTLPAGLNPPGK